MEKDRTEIDDLSAKQPKLVESLSKKWDAWAAANQVTPLPANTGRITLECRHPQCFGPANLFRATPRQSPGGHSRSDWWCPASGSAGG
jgi:hypothetical protein